MKLNDLLKLDVQEVLDLVNKDPKELRAITARLGAAAQKRTKRLTEQLGKDGLPYVVERFVEQGGYKGIRNKSTPQVVTEYQRLRSFLLNKGSTAKGQREYAQEFAEHVGLPPDTSYRVTSSIIRSLDRLREMNPDLFRSGVIDSDQVVKMLHEEVEQNPNQSAGKLVDKVQERVNELYKHEEMRRTDTSGFFDGGADTFALGRP